MTKGSTDLFSFDQERSPLLRSIIVFDGSGHFHTAFSLSRPSSTGMSPFTFFRALTQCNLFNVIEISLRKRLSEEAVHYIVDGFIFVVVAVAVVILRSITVFDRSGHFHTVEAFIDRNVTTLISEFGVLWRAHTRRSRRLAVR